MQNWLDQLIGAVLLLLTSLIVFPGLGSTRLWVDEAHTAVVAHNISKSGLPKAWDGKNLVSIFGDRRDIRRGLYIWQAWLPSYLAGASIAIFGSNSFGARFPFAIAFVLLIGLSYRIFRRWDPDYPHRSLLAAVLMITCVALLLHARQCRYYVLAPLFNLLIVDAYIHVLENPKPRYIAGLVFWFTLLFNSFYPGAPVMGLALGLDLLIRRPRGQVVKALFFAAAVFTLVNLPVALFCRVWGRQFGVQPGYSDLPVFGAYLLRYALTVNTFFFPLIIVLVAGLWRWRDLLPKVRTDKTVFVLLVVCGVQLVLFALISDYPFTRYLVGIVPFVMFLGARCVWSLAQGRAWLAWTLVLVMATTNMLHLVPLPLLRWTSLQDAQWTVAGVNVGFLEPGNVGLSYAKGEVKEIINTPLSSPLVSYLKSTLNPPRGPIDWIVDHLRENASPADRVKITYGDLPLMFHTDLTITCGADVGPSAPQWLIYRHFNHAKVNKLFLLETAQHQYAATELPIPDIQWNNRPDPLYHFFTPPHYDDLPRVKILRRTN